MAITFASLKAAGRALFGNAGSAPATTPKAEETIGRFSPKGPRNGGAYDSAKNSPRRGSTPGPSPTDARNELPQYTRLELVRKSRYHSKNTGLIRQVHQDMRLYSVGEGLIGKAVGGSKEWNAKAQAIWDDFCRSCDITGRFSFAEMQDLVCGSVDKDGEVFALKVRDPNLSFPKLQIIRTHRCWNGYDGDPDFVDGVKLDYLGRPLAYRFERDDGTMREVPAPAVMHIYDAEDYDSTRYVPAGQHAFDHMQDEREVISMEKQNMKELARNPRIFKRGAKPPTTESEQENEIAFGNGVRAEDVPEGTDPEAVEKVFGGETLFIENDEEVLDARSERPSPEFMNFMGWLHRDSTGGLLPFEFVHDPSKVGGASVRLVTSKAGRVFSKRSSIVERRFCQPVFTWVIADAIANGELEPNPTWWKCVWIRPQNVTVDAGRDRKADRDDLITGNRTFTEDFGEYGQNFEQEMTRRAEELAFIRELEAKHNLPPGLLYNPAPASNAAAQAAGANPDDNSNDPAP